MSATNTIRRLAVLVLIAAWCGACTAPDGDQVVKVSDVWLRPGAAEMPPADGDPGWRQGSLPDAWTLPRRRVATEGWYRVEVELARPPEMLWAVYLPWATLNVAVFVNGELVGDGGRFTEPMARNHGPLLFSVPVRLLTSGPNRVAVRLKMNRTAPGVLAPFYIGPEAALRPAYERRYRGK